MKTILRKTGQFFVKSDNILWILSLIAFIYSVVLLNSIQRATDYVLTSTQIIAILLGFIIAIIITIIDYKYYIKIWWAFAALSVLLIISIFIFGVKVEGTDDKAWIFIGSVSFQPSELLKVFFIITFSKHLQFLIEKDYLKNIFGILSLVVHTSIPIIALHLSGEDGTAIIFVFLFIVMTFIAGVQARYFVIFFVALAASAPLLWNFVLSEEHKNRIMAIFNLSNNTMMDYGWQQYQGKVSIASGGLNGTGLGKGPRVESLIVPEQANDFIFTAAGEELGFIGCVLILIILLLIMIRIIIVGIKSRDITGKIICFGVFSMIASQTIINIGMVLGLLPVIGITLPFFSSGGTSVLSVLFSIGFVESVYYHKDETEANKGVILADKYKFMRNIHNEY